MNNWLNIGLLPRIMTTIFMSNSKNLAIRKVKEKIQDYVKVLKKGGFKIQHVYLYGSFSTGNFHKDSDIDVAIVSETLGKNREKKEKTLWHSTLEVDPRIEPVGYTPEEFISIDPLVWEIKKDGMEIKT